MPSDARVKLQQRQQHEKAKLQQSLETLKMRANHEMQNYTLREGTAKQDFMVSQQELRQKQAEQNSTAGAPAQPARDALQHQLGGAGIGGGGMAPMDAPQRSQRARSAASAGTSGIEGGRGSQGGGPSADGSKPPREAREGYHWVQSTKSGTRDGYIGPFTKKRHYSETVWTEELKMTDYQREMITLSKQEGFAEIQAMNSKTYPPQIAARMTQIALRSAVGKGGLMLSDEDAQFSSHAKSFASMDDGRKADMHLLKSGQIDQEMYIAREKERRDRFAAETKWAKDNAGLVKVQESLLLDRARIFSTMRKAYQGLEGDGPTPAVVSNAAFRGGWDNPKVFSGDGPDSLMAELMGDRETTIGGLLATPGKRDIGSYDHVSVMSMFARVAFSLNSVLVVGDPPDGSGSDWLSGFRPGGDQLVPLEIHRFTEMMAIGSGGIPSTEEAPKDGETPAEALGRRDRSRQARDKVLETLENMRAGVVEDMKAADGSTVVDEDGKPIRYLARITDRDDVMYGPSNKMHDMYEGYRGTTLWYEDLEKAGYDIEKPANIADVDAQSRIARQLNPYARDAVNDYETKLNELMSQERPGFDPLPPWDPSLSAPPQFPGQ